MSKDSIKGATQKAAGLVEQAAGKATGSRKMEAKGAANRAAGATKEAVGKTNDAIKKKTK